MKKMYSMKWLFIVLCFGLATTVLFGQHSIGAPIVNPSAELALGSKMKGMLFNRVKLESVTSTKPLSNDVLTPGIIVYNTSVGNGLIEGFYFWSSDKKWNKLYNAISNTRQSSYVDFLQSNGEVTLTGTAKNIGGLDYTYKATDNGDLFLDYVIYSSIRNDKNLIPVHAAKSIFQVTVTEGIGQTKIIGSMVASPYVVVYNQGANVTTGVGAFSFRAEKGKTYKISIIGQSIDGVKNYEVLAGDFKYGTQSSKSSLKITFLSL